MRLRKQIRIDNLKNEIRRRGNPWDRLIYFGLVGGFLLWMFDIFLGDYFYLRADGLVLSDSVVLATQFTAQFTDLTVVEGGEAKRGQEVVRVRSKEVEETLAKLSTELANALARKSQLSVRLKVIESVRDMALHSVQSARVSRVKGEALISGNLISNKRVSELIDSELKSTILTAEMAAEEIGIKQELPILSAAIDEASQARDRLKGGYNEGRIDSPVDGVVGRLPVSLGSVARIGEPLMTIYTGTPYILAYVPEGALYSLRLGDEVKINVGVNNYRGSISHIFPVTSQLPKEFQDSVRQPARAQAIRIKFADGESPPTLFAKPRISTPSWLSQLLSGGAASAKSRS